MLHPNNIHVIQEPLLRWALLYSCWANIIHLELHIEICLMISKQKYELAWLNCWTVASSNHNVCFVDKWGNHGNATMFDDGCCKNWMLIYMWLRNVWSWWKTGYWRTLDWSAQVLISITASYHQCLMKRLCKLHDHQSVLFKFRAK